MLALLALSLAAAFPPRGAVSQRVEASITLDSDVVKVRSIPVLECGGVVYSVDSGSNPLLKIDSFPGRSSSRYFVNILPSLAGCLDYWNRIISSFQSAKYSVQGRSRWALWNDSVWKENSTTKVSPNPGLPYYDGWVRWRWSRLDGATAWARWTDTVHLGTPESFPGPVPLLSLLIATAIDSVVPAEANRPQPTFGQNLTLRRDTSDALGTLNWSSIRGSADLQRTRSWSTLPVGSTLYVSAAATDSVGTRLWRIWSGGAVRDSFWIERPAPASLRARPAPLRAPDGSWSIDGRRRTGISCWTPRFGIGETGTVGGAK